MHHILKHGFVIIALAKIFCGTIFIVIISGFHFHHFPFIERKSDHCTASKWNLDIYCYFSVLQDFPVYFVFAICRVISHMHIFQFSVHQRCDQSFFKARLQGF